MDLTICLEEKPPNINEIEWSAAHDHALCTMLAYLDSTILKQVEEYFEVLKLFDALQRRFHQKNQSIVMNIYMQLLRFSMKSGTKIQNHIHAFVYLLVDLWNMRDELPNTKKAMHLLHSVLSTYQMRSKILLHCQNTTVTYNEVVSALLTDAVEQDLLSLSVTSTSETLLIMTQGQSQPRDTNDSQRS